MIVTFTEITLTGQTYAYAVWRFADNTTQIVYLTQAQWDTFAVTNRGMGEPAGNPGGVFIFGAGGLPAFNTPTGRPRIGDFWVRSETTREIVLYTGADPNWSYGSSIADVPINGQSRLQGREFGTTNNTLAITLTPPLLSQLRAGTLTRSFGQINVVNNVADIPANYVTRLEAMVDRQIPNHRSVTFDASSHGNDVSFGTTITIAHTVTSSQSFLYMAVGYGWRSASISGITYNGVALSSRIATVTANNTSMVVYDKTNPATGTHNIVGTVSTNAVQAMSAVSCYGVNQTTPTTATNSNSNVSSSSPSVTISSNTNDLVYSHLAWNDSAAASNTGDATWNLLTQDNPAGGFIGGHGAYINGAASITRTDTLSANAEWVLMAVAIKADTTPVNTLNASRLMRINRRY